MVAAASAAVGPGLTRYAWVVAALPVASALLTLFVGRRTPGKGAVYGIVATGAGLALSLGILWHFVVGGRATGATIEWFQVGPLHLQLGQFVDGLTAVMFVVVTGVSLCVHVYSLGYMAGDARYTWFYVVLSVFTAAMLDVVVADNLFQLLVGWEVMGICSYLLIGHWWEERNNSNAAIKAFITTRTGDVPFLFGIFALVLATGLTTSNIRTISEMAARGSISQGLLIAGALLLFGGTIGKSAQFPLYVWLPDAMAGPTPVSALIHAATMVAAGVYMVARMFEIFVQAEPFVRTIVAVVGAVTLLAAAFLALVQDDIKRVLAYSTVSQLAYMVAVLGLGESGYTPAMFHLFTHAFFKALLFLGAGSVIHAVHSNDMTDMGGLRRALPITFVTFVIGSAALSGVPPFSGFFSKDELIVAAYNDHAYWLMAVLVLGAVVTAFYTTRMVVLTFLGDYRGHGHPHESPASMTAPLVALAGATCVTGFLGFGPAGAVFFDWVYFGHPETVSFVAGIALLSVAAVAVGVALSYRLYATWRETDPLVALGAGYRLLQNKYYLDDLYYHGVVAPIRDRASAAVNWFNQRIIDGVVNGAARAARRTASVVNLFDRTVVDGAVNGAGELADESGGILRYLQSGNVQRYAALLFVGVIALAIVFTRLAL